VVLMMGRDGQDPLFLQAKEAEGSVLEPYVGESEFGSHAERVVEGQWLMQASSDILLGWLPALGFDGRERDFYWLERGTFSRAALPAAARSSGEAASTSGGLVDA
jgi:hypothetical protein